MTPEYLDNLFILIILLMLFIAGLGVCNYLVHAFLFLRERRMFRRYWET